MLPPSPSRARLRAAAAILCLAPGVGAENILLVIADDLGVDRVAAYGEHPDPGNTPTIDGLAARGVLFRNVWANPTCSPTRATLFTGRYGVHTGIGSTVAGGQINHGLLQRETTIAELLDGYTTAIVGKWHLAAGSQGEEHPLVVGGFDTHVGSLRNLAPHPADYYAWEKLVDGEESLCTTYATVETTNDALAFLAKAEEPWLLVLSYNAPHRPFHAPPVELHSFALEGDPDATPVEHCKAAIEALDTELGRLLEAVDESRATVLFLGDNGTEGMATSEPFDSERAKSTMYEGGLNVPLIVAGKAVPETSRGSECAALVNTTDVFATMAALGGEVTDLPDSVSLMPYLENPSRASLREWVYAENFRPNGGGPTYKFRMRAVRDARYKLIRRLEEPDELYDLQRDPFEQENLLALDPVPEAAELARSRLGGILKVVAQR